MTDSVTVQTITGPVAADALGLTLPHEHLFADFRRGASGSGESVTAEDGWRLRDDPYSSRDHMLLDDDATVHDELAAFARMSGRTVIDQTPPSVGRDLPRLEKASLATGVQIIAGAGYYLEEFHPPTDLSLTADQMTERIITDLRRGDGPAPGVIGEVGVSPRFTEWEHRSLRAAARAQQDTGVPLFIHIPSWERLGRDVVRIVVDEEGVEPGAVVLCHMDASGVDPRYQLELADRGVVLEFDMVGMPYWLTDEGQCPTPDATAAAIAGLVQAGHVDRILLSHDLWLKTMYRRYGGNGLLYVPGAFPTRLERAGVSPDDAITMTHVSIRRLFEHAQRGNVSSPG